MRKHKTKILYVVFTILFWLLCFQCTAQTKKQLFVLDSVPVLTERGIDCSQFNKRLYADVYKLELQNVCYKQWEQTERIKLDSLQIGDLLFFRSSVSPSGWHCATYIGETLFVHAANRYEGVKISSINEPRYRKALRGAGRVKK